MVKYSDLAVGVTHEYESTGKGITDRFKLGMGLFAAINTARDFTQLTQREVAFVLYSSIDNLVAPKNYVNVVCPQFGSDSQVHNPEFDQMHRAQERDGEIYVPVFHLHTHPRSPAVPSEMDLRNSFERRAQRLSDNGHAAWFHVREINVIHGTDLLSRTHLLFYQFDGNEDKDFRSFMAGYDRLLKDQMDKYFRGGPSNDIPVVLARFFQSHGPFTTLYYRHEEPSIFNRKPLSENDSACKKLMEKVRRKFKFRFTVRRVR